MSHYDLELLEYPDVDRRWEEIVQCREEIAELKSRQTVLVEAGCGYDEIEKIDCHIEQLMIKEDHLCRQNREVEAALRLAQPVLRRRGKSSRSPKVGEST